MLIITLCDTEVSRMVWKKGIDFFVWNTNMDLFTQINSFDTSMVSKYDGINDDTSCM